jgi:hypothetical protein
MAMKIIGKREEAMADKNLPAALPENFETLETFWDFWDTHSSADYEADMEDVDVEIDLTTEKVYFAIAKDLVRKVRHQAKYQGVSVETLINLWLQEKLAEMEPLTD